MKKHIIYAKCSTWSRDSHMLYDYENKEVIRKTLKIQANCFISRTNNTIEQVTEQTSDTLLSLSTDSREPTVSSLSQAIWQVIRNARGAPSPRQYSLRQGTIIKLGRLQFEVKALKSKEDNLQEVETVRVKDTSKICRICFIEDSQDDPLIAICKCAGSIENIHVKCLQSWILSKITTSSDNLASKFLRSIHCELCREKLPFILKVEGVVYDMLKGHKPKVPFLILEGIQSEQREPGVYFISFADKNSVMLGRGHDSDVRIPDISVSRCHAKISFVNDEFVIEDNFSKFGTLVKMESPFVLEGKITVQCGRTIIELSKTNSGKEDKFEWEVED